MNVEVAEKAADAFRAVAARYIQLRLLHRSVDGLTEWRYEMKTKIRRLAAAENVDGLTRLREALDAAVERDLYCVDCHAQFIEQCGCYLVEVA